MLNYGIGWGVAVYPAIQFVASTLADAISVSDWNVPCHRHDYFHRRVAVWSGRQSWCSGIWKDALWMLLNICIPSAVGWREDFEW